MQQSGRALAALLPLLSAVAAHRRPFHLGRHRDAPSASASGCDTPGFVECPAGSASAGICVPALSPWCALLPYLNPYADDGVRVADLLPRLTLAQKVNLMQTTPVANNAVPDLAILQYGTAECLHGYCGGAPSTLFPQSTTLAASFSPPLLRRVAAAIGTEARGWRNSWTFNSSAPTPPPSLTCLAPQINIVRDPRWGRAQETYGEDPFLTASMASAYIAGLQRGDDSSADGASLDVDGPLTYLLAGSSTKHMIAYQGASTRGDHSPTNVFLSDRDLIDTYSVAWRASVAAGTASVMCAYSSLCPDDTNATCALPPPAGFGVSLGVPMCANEELLNGWLRGGADGAAPSWDGVVVGDCGAVQFIQTDHLWTTSQEGAAAAAINSGVDFDCSISVGNGFAALLNASAAGLVNSSTIDRALGRLLRLQLRLGYFDPQDMVPYASIPKSVVNSPAHRALAATAARMGIVLLRNARGVLPLNAAALNGAGTVLVTGPLGDSFLVGNYNTNTDVNVTVLAGVRAFVPSPAFVPGCSSVTSNDTAGFALAVAAAAQAAVVVAVLGLDGSVEYEDSTRASLALPGVQEQLLLALAATGTPVVVLLVGGSGVSLSPAALRAAAAIAWVGYGGEEAGTAAADAVFGVFSPGGRLPFSFFGSADDLPPYYNMSMVGLPHGRTYRYYYGGPAAVFRFGEGTSYSQMATTAAQFNASGGVLPMCESLEVSALVANAGPMDGDEVTQVYVRLLDVAPLVTPRLALAAFARTPLVAGAAPTLVTLLLPPRTFAVVDGATRQWVLRPTRVGVVLGSVAPESEADWAGPNAAVLTLTGASRPLSSCGN